LAQVRAYSTKGGFVPFGGISIIWIKRFRYETQIFLSQFLCFFYSLKGVFEMKNKFFNAISLAVILTLIAATWVLADNLLTDGDGLTPVVDTASLNLGNVCLGSTTTKPIAHAISRNGNYNNAMYSRKAQM